MTTVANARIDIEADGASEAQRALGAVTGALQALGAAALAVAGAGLAAIGAALNYSIQQAMEAQAVMAQTNAVIKSTGGAAGVSAAQVLSLADSYSALTGIQDDVIQQAENMLLTFTNISDDVFPAATATALDMSVALGQDAVQSSVMLGKALNDPINGITALQRVGVTFSDTQKQQIKDFMAVNDVASAQGVILDELAKEFGGSAEAFGKTAAGQFEIFKNRLSEIGEAAGNILLPALGEVLNVVGPEIIKALEASLPLVQTFANLLTSIALAAQAGVPPLENLSRNFMSLLPPETRTALEEFLASLQTQFGPAFESISASLNTIGMQLTAFWQAHGEDIIASVSAHLNVVATIFSGVLQFIAGIVAAITAAMNGNWFTAMAALENGASGALDTIAGLFGSSGAEIAATWQGVGEQISIIANAIGTNIVMAISNAIAGAIAKAKEAVKIGQAIVDGIVSAITGGAAAIVDALVGAVMAAVAAAMAATESASPSKLTAREIGAPMGQGVAAGIVSQFGMVADALSGLVTSGVSETTNNYNLNIHTNAPREPIEQDFNMMKAWAT